MADAYRNPKILPSENHDPVAPDYRQNKQDAVAEQVRPPRLP
jgi:hypothetical protein